MKQRICILFFFQASEERDKKQRSKDTVGAGLAFVCTAQVMRLGLMGMAVTADSHSIKFKGKERGHEKNSVCTLLWGTLLSHHQSAPVPSVPAFAISQEFCTRRNLMAS